MQNKKAVLQKQNHKMLHLRIATQSIQVFQLGNQLEKAVIL